MSLSGLSVRRPVLVLMIISALMVLGAVAYGRLPVELFPSVEFPFVSVTVVYPGAGPEEVQQFVAKPLEEQLSSLPNVRQVRTVASEGLVVVAVEFELGTNVDVATADVRQRVDIAKVRFPRDVEEPVVAKFDFAAEPVLNIGLGGTRSPRELRLLAEDVIKPRFERVPGVAAVNVSGGRVREIRIEVDQERLRAVGLGVVQLEETLRAENLNVPGGKITENAREFLVRLTGQFSTLQQIADLRLRRPDGSLIRLSDVAVVRDLSKDPTQYTRLNGRDSVGLTVQKQSGANTVQVSDGVRRAIAELQRTLPGDVSFGIAQDQSKMIRASIKDVQDNLILGSILATIVIFLFLHNVRSTIIIALSLPTAIIATYFPMFVAGFTINIMSLLALAIAIGLMTDNAIVVNENISRHLDIDATPQDAAREGSKEIELAVLVGNLANMAIFIPIAFTRGIVGQFFRQFGLTVVFANLFSVLVGFMLTPMLSARWLRRQPPRVGRRGFWDRWDGVFDRAAERYRRILAWCLGHRFVTLAAATVLFFGSIGLLMSGAIGSEFFPVSDTGEFRTRIELPIGSSLDVADRAARRVEATLRQIPEVTTFFTQVGALSQGFGFQTPGTQIAEIAVSLVDRSERTRSVDAVMEEVRQRTSGIPAAKIKVSAGSEAGGGQAPIQIEVLGPDLARLQPLAAQVEDIVRKTPGAVNVDNTLTSGKPEIQVSLDQERVAMFGLNAAAIGAAIRSSIEGVAVTRYRVGGDEFDITVRARPEDRNAVARIGEIGVGQLQNGTAIRLRDVATFKVARGPSTVQRKNRVQFALITADLGGRPLGSVVADIQKQTDTLAMPAGFSISYAGEAQFQAESFRDMLQSLVLGILFVYMVMAAQMESLINPLVVMFTLPLAAIGVFPALALARVNVSIMSLLGIIMLAGIIVNNAVILVDYTTQLRKEGRSRRDALLTAGRTRFRPILMTALVTILGGLPVALGLGTSGAEWRRPLGVAVLGGLLSSTFLTLLVIPVVYELLEDIIGLFRRRRAPVPVAHPGAMPAPVEGAANGQPAANHRPASNSEPDRRV
jgi:HAE1 family hydrophobic/amphiphilic exporter-1